MDRSAAPGRRRGSAGWFEIHEESPFASRAEANWGSLVGARAAVFLELGSYDALIAALVQAGWWCVRS